LIDARLGRVIGQGGAAQSQFGANTQGFLTDVLEGGVSPDQSVIDRDTASLRETLDRQRRSQTSQLEARLARRGLLGSGAEKTGLEGIERDLGSKFASAFRDIGTGELTRARGTFEQGLGLSQQESGQERLSLASALGQGTQRQGLFSDIALRMTDQNQSAAQFAAEFGLTREAMLAQMQSNKLLSLLGPLSQFSQGAAITQRGAV